MQALNFLSKLFYIVGRIFSFFFFIVIIVVVVSFISVANTSQT